MKCELIGFLTLKEQDVSRLNSRPLLTVSGTAIVLKNKNAPFKNSEFKIPVSKELFEFLSFSGVQPKIKITLETIE